MLQQTQVSSATPYFLRWMAAFPSIESLAQADEHAVLHLWQGLGYYSRARNLHRTAKEVVRQFSGSIPHEPAVLKKLPGVGAYSAGAIASFGFNLPVAAVDANIARVLARIANYQSPIDSTEGNRFLWNLATALLPTHYGGRLHNSSLMELGALVCTPKKPQCLICPVRSECRASDPASLPKKAPRKAVIAIDETAAWIEHHQCVLLEKQTGRRSGGLWKLPLLTELPEGSQPLLETSYPFTHHKVTLRVYPAAVPDATADHQQWFPISTVLKEAALPSGHRRALTALVQAKSLLPLA